MRTKVLIVGVGGLGSAVLHLLSRSFPGEIVAVGRSERGLHRFNLVRLAALAEGHDPAIRYSSVDLHRVDEVATLLHAEQPDLLVHTATLQTWWLTDLLPEDDRTRFKKAGFGHWLPVHLTLALKLMRAVRAASLKGFTLTAPFPDVVNPVLGCLGLAPDCGLGNLDEVVPKLRLLSARALSVSPADVGVKLIAHHALEPYVFGEAEGEMPPYLLRISCRGLDVSESVRADELLFHPFPIPAGPATSFLTAASAVRLITALTSQGETELHAPAPNGLPGGYPVRAGNFRVAPSLPEDVDLASAVAINERSHRFDGIERVESDGTVVFSPEGVELMSDLLGYNCPSLAPAESEERATELIDRFRRFAARRGVHLEEAERLA